MKRFLFNLFFLSIFVVLLVFSASAATQPAYEMEHTMIVARLDTNTSQGWNAYYQYTETWPFDDSYLGLSTPQLQLILDSKTFVHTDFKVYRADGNPLAYAGHDVSAALSNIYVSHWTSYNDTWYTWEKGILCSVVIEYTDGTTENVNDNNFSYNALTQEFSLTTDFQNVSKDIKSITFSSQYWPYNYDGLYSPSTYFQVSYFAFHFPRFDIFSFTPGGSGGSGSDAPEGIGGMIDSVLNDANSGFDSISSFFDKGITLVQKYSSSLMGVAWIMGEFLSVSFVSDLTIFSASLGILILLFGVSLTVARSGSHGRSGKSYSGKKGNGG